MRQTIAIIEAIVTFFIAFTTETYKYHWLSASIIAIVCLIVDFTFFQPEMFIYDPDYKHWKDVTEREEFDIKQE